MAEFKTRRNKGWAEYTENIRMLVDKAYPSLTYKPKNALHLITIYNIWIIH